MVIPVTSNDLPLASQHLRHYLTGTGEPVSFPVREHLKQMEKTIDEEMGELARFAATIHERGKLIAFSSTKSRGGYFPREETKDLFYAVGGYQIWLDGQICVKYSRLFEANVTLHFYDRYNWDKGKCVFFHLPNSALVWMVEYCVGNSGPIRVDGDFLIVEDEALGRLHRQGLAREFDITGSVNLSVSGEIGKKPDYTQTTSVDGRR